MDTHEPNPIALDPSQLEALIEAAAVNVGRLFESQGREGLDVARAWIKQRADQVRTMGEAKAPHYVYWLDPDGNQHSKSCGPGKEGLKNANKVRRKIEAELLTGTYQSNSGKTWGEFRQEYEQNVLPALAPNSQKEIRTTLNHFERLAKPGRACLIKAQAIDRYKASRLLEGGKKAGTMTQPPTINKELRQIKAALNKAKKWGFISTIPEIEFLPELKKLPTYVPPEGFQKLYGACSKATRPVLQGATSPDWWRAIIVVAYMTGWRIGQLLAFRREDLDPATGEILTHAADNKGKRDQKIVLHALAVEHLQKLKGFGDVWFPWPHRQADLWNELHRLEDLAGVPRYGFHDFRRAFATLNADRMTGDALQSLMQHKSYSTTQLYINLGRQMKPAAANLFVPELPPPQSA